MKKKLLRTVVYLTLKRNLTETHVVNYIYVAGK